MKKSIVLATAVASILTSGVAAAELTANAGVFSNYIWRGVTQTADAAAGQGGIDWSGDSGLYAGTWLSTIDGGQEVDVYAGFAGEAGSFGYDLGVITYQYPVTPSELNFTEVYASGSIVGITVGLAYTVDKASGASDPDGNDDDLYLHASYDFAMKEIDYSIYLGNYSFDADTTGDTDYTHYGASLSKDGFTFAVDKNDIEATNPGFGGVGGAGTEDRVRFTVSYAVDFEL